MTITFLDGGAKILLEKIKKLQQGIPLTNADVEAVISHPDIDVWIFAYVDWIENAQETYSKILESLLNEPPVKLEKWGDRIKWGLRRAIESRENMENILDILRVFDWTQTERTQIPSTRNTN